MKKVFISKPIAIKTDGEILEERERLKTLAKERFGEDVEFLETFFKKDFDGNALAFLGRSISMLAEADAAIFDKDWKTARGCRIECMCCIEYGIEIIK
jgi:hypothetical protein